MQFLRLCSAALLLLLGTAITQAQAAQGFDDKSFPAGPPKPEVKYHVIVPEGIVITNKKGEVYKEGDTVLVPGANVTVLESAYVKEHIKDTNFKSSFVSERSYMPIATDEK